MIVDTYIKGKSFNKCEDYIISGKENDFSYIILSDGCSSSKNTDIGSRILCLSCKQFLEKELFSNTNIQEEKPKNELEIYYNKRNITYERVACEVAVKSSLILCDLLDQKPDIIDATLILMLYKENDPYVYIYMYGDGFIILRNKNNEIMWVSVDFEPNYPYYLNYLNSNEQHENYEKLNPTLITKTSENAEKIYNIVSCPPLNSSLKFDTQMIFKILKEDLRSIIISSDGISKNTFTNLNFNEFVNNITDIPNPVGKILSRSCNREIERLLKLGIVNNDDLSLGMFYFGD